MTPAPAPLLITEPLSLLVTPAPEPLRMVLPETTPLPSHLAGLTLMPGTVLSSLVLSIRALSEFCANTPMAGIEKTGTAGISPGLSPGTVAVALALAADFALAVATVVGLAELSAAGLVSEPQAPSANSKANGIATRARRR